ncbi:hypothetical protein JCM6292_120 [Bacteroides pyogenes JCM 6292]|uniref:Uncharacterized protein n=2 Tax=Bacteroides pyogenes TaxID=310300 RepID=W4PCC2_9BACE|nr:hypothetical protein JCM6292_120 [Bacteroides pyogenes JCM 6292]GAE17385.1 hypothetical protein JCM6294_123 [Bacteroides pyogenes DSM 20611 = JCM 6294]
MPKRKNFLGKRETFLSTVLKFSWEIPGYYFQGNAFFFQTDSFAYIRIFRKKEIPLPHSPFMFLSRYPDKSRITDCFQT